MKQYIQLTHLACILERTRCESNRKGQKVQASKSQQNPIKRKKEGKQEAGSASVPQAWENLQQRDNVDCRQIFNHIIHDCNHVFLVYLKIFHHPQC